MYWGTSRWSAMEIMVNADLSFSSLFPNVVLSSSDINADHWRCHFYLSIYLKFPKQEAYSVARQFNLIPPVCEQAEYHYFQRDKVEVQLPELYHKIGETLSVHDNSDFLYFNGLMLVLFQSYIYPCTSPSGVGAMTWSPLACGLITGKYSDGVPECSRAAMKVSLIWPTLLWDFCHLKSALM